MTLRIACCCWPGSMKLAWHTYVPTSWLCCGQSCAFVCPCQSVCPYYLRCLLLGALLLAEGLLLPMACGIPSCPCHMAYQPAVARRGAASPAREAQLPFCLPTTCVMLLAADRSASKQARYLDAAAACRAPASAGHSNSERTSIHPPENSLKAVRHACTGIDLVAWGCR